MIAAQEKKNLAHSKSVKGTFAEERIQHLESLVEKMGTEQTALLKEKKSLKSRIEVSEKVLPQVKTAGTAHSEYSNVIRMFYEQFVAAVDTQIASALEKQELNGDCPPQQISQTVCDFLTRKMDPKHQFWGMPQQTLSRVAIRIPRLMAAFYAEGATKAAQNPARFEAVSVSSRVFARLREPN